MAWDRDRAIARISEFKQKALDTEISVQSFADQYYPAHEAQRLLNERSGDWELPIFKLPYNKAISTDGVHIYARLVNFESFVKENGLETEASHRNMLQFLHLHYSACDRLIRSFEIQRVDYHSGRMHAVVLTPTGPENENIRIDKAIKFSSALRKLANSASRVLSDGRLNATMRIGIDSGPAVAINGGRGAESDPLFLGNAANIAAKLADGAHSGVYLSDNVRAKLGAVSFIRMADSGLTDIYESTILEGRVTLTDEFSINQRITDVAESLSTDQSLLDSLDSSKSFKFHQHAPPLNSLKFKELMPSRTVRMPMVSIFADLAGFTKYVGKSIDQNRIAEMVSNIHILRRELTSVLRDDFSGKKIRYIGDCIQGEIAIGTSSYVNIESSITQAVLCCSALRSSFDLCGELLGLEDLGISIGIESGATPITRLGLSGDNSVRCSSSASVCTAEDEQKRCEGDETAMGLTAYGSATSNVKNIFKNNRVISNLDYAIALTFIDSSTQSVSSSNNKKPVRAHFKK